MKLKRRGRRTKYSPKLGQKICESISAGYTVEVAARKHGVSPSSVSLWRSENLEFLEMYDHALKLGIPALAEEVLEIIDDRDLDPREIKIQLKRRKRLVERHYRHMEVNAKLRASIIAQMSMEEKEREALRLLGLPRR